MNFLRKISFYDNLRFVNFKWMSGFVLVLFRPLFNAIHQISNLNTHKIKIVKNVNVFILLKENNRVTVLSRKKSTKSELSYRLVMQLIVLRRIYEKY